MRRTFKCLAIVCASLMSLSMSAPTQFSSANCPTIEIDCPTSLLEPNESFNVTANITGADPNPKLSYRWSISTGTIIDGQGTPSIIVKIAKPHCQSFTATVEISGLDSSCQDSASCSIIPGLPPVSRKFDEYGDISFDDKKGRLDKFATQLKNEPNSQGHIVFYHGGRANNRAFQRKAERDRAYLINTNGIEATRIFAVQGGERAERTIELWISPQGAPVPPDFASSLPQCP